MFAQTIQTDKSEKAGSRRHSDTLKHELPSRTLVHAKLEMTEPGDADEREAETMASDIVSGGKVRREVSSGFGGGSGIAVSTQMESQLSQLQGGGHAMPDGLRSMMESGFGRDFSQVRLHTDAQAADMSSSISARAFTHGNDIYFNRGQFSPSSTEGQRLLAHELTHVAQGTGKVGRKPCSGPSCAQNPLFPANPLSATQDAMLNAEVELDVSTFSEEDLRAIYNELIKHGLLYAISENVYKWSNGIIETTDNALSPKSIAWVKDVQKKVGGVKNISHVFVIIGRVATVSQACNLVYKALQLQRGASDLERMEYTLDTTLFLIGTVGGVPGTILALTIASIRDYAMNNIDTFIDAGKGWNHLFHMDFLNHSNPFDMFNDLMSGGM